MKFALRPPLRTLAALEEGFPDISWTKFSCVRRRGGIEAALRLSDIDSCGELMKVCN